ncbi:acid phosphatase [Tomitella biformata]|uniref:acid phosphatase n=1 Tax=Tomitella biformata TaxID=630403 RepID=UPI0004BCF9FA|nr:phosphatase PAP2 family protein [Tomitella biformata]
MTRTRRTIVAALALAAVALPLAAPSALAAPAQPNAQPSSEPFGLDRLLRIYESDNSETGRAYLHVVDSFTALRAERPDIMAENLDLTVAFNQSAVEDPALQARALDDAHDDVLVTMSDGLGAELGAHFRAALAEGRLPKTSQLLAGTFARGGGLANSTFIEKYLFGYDRPFVVAPERITRYERAGEDGYGTTPAFPSGHTNQATWKADLLAMMVPELGPQLVARGSEAGQNRLVMGVHYPLDVIGGRMTGDAAAADRWHDPLFRQLILEAGDELRAELEWRCGAELSVCIANDTPYLSTEDAVDVFTARMTYGFPTVAATDAPMVVPTRAVALLAAQFPELTDDQRAEVLRQTALESGYPLDDQGETGSWQRINLARALAADVAVSGDGTVTIRG